MPAKPPNRVFVVDNQPVISQTLAAILSRAGYRAMAFDAAQRAIDEARLNPPDLLISNIAMPEMTGVELAIKVQKQSPTCKILLFSGQGSTAELSLQAHETGNDFEVLVRPGRPQDILKSFVPCAPRDWSFEHLRPELG
jgi:DNA-binding NtrC family response regulator